MDSNIDYEQLPQKNILCVDMKSFFASIEAVARGFDPRKVLLAVVGDKEREGSVILAASSAFKEKYGLGTGNRLYEVPERDEIIIVEARMALYLEISMQITRLFNDFVPLDAIHVYSIDEAWLKLDGTEKLFGKAMEMAAMIRNTIQKRFHLDCSMGLGPNMFLAKVAMDIEGKKKGLAEWGYDDVQKKLWPVKVEDCWGIGSRLSKQFHSLGIKTVGDIAHLPLSYLEDRFGIMGAQLYYHSWGVDLSRLEGHYTDQEINVGRGITLLRDYDIKEEIETVIFDLSEEVARRCRKRGLSGKTVSLGVSYSKEELKNGFHVQRTANNYINLTGELFNICQQLFEENYRGEVVRKINVSLGNFSHRGIRQLNLFEDKAAKTRITRIRDKLQDRFGYRALFYGRSLKRGSVRKRINTTIGGHKTN